MTIGWSADETVVAARDFQLTFESPKNEQLSLFRLGELAYEHLILTPPKSKGIITNMEEYYESKAN